MSLTRTDPALRLVGVSKRFGAHMAVEHLDLEIPRGCLYGLLGPNGSGKTTTLRMIMGILHPDRGRVELLGADDLDAARRRRVGYLPEERGLYARMGVLDFLVFIGEIRGLARGDARDRARGWLDRLDLAGWAGRRCADLSKGMQQKVQFAATVLHDPELLILDEPFSGLDPINQDELEAIVLDFHARGSTILFSTHRMEQAERLCRRVCLMAGARKILDGEIRELKARARRGTVAVAFDGDADWVEGPGVARAEPAGDGWHLTLEEGADAEAVLRRGLAAGVGIRRFEMVEPRLHEIFVDHVAAAGGGRPPNPTGSPGRRRRAAETPAGGTP